MSEVENDVTDILLPAAKVAVFSHDAETLQAARALRDDWRFARVDLQVVEGDVEAAISKYSYESAPSLLIIQTETIDSGFTGRLEALSEHCNEGTSAVIVGPVNDVNLYRRLIDMGVSDYLVKPVATDVMGEVIARTLVSKLGVDSSRLIAFLGAKGGVGTSSIAQACAWRVASVLKQKLVLMDAAGGWSSLGVGMGFDPTATLAAVSRAVEAGDADSLKRMFHTADEKLSVLATGGDSLLGEALAPEKYERILDNLMAKAPVVLVDLSQADVGLSRVTLSRANHIVLVSTPTLASLRLTRSLLKEIGDLRGGSADEVSLLINRRGLSKADEVPDGDIQVAIDRKPSGSIPFLPGLFMGFESEARQILSDKEGSVVLHSTLLPLMQKMVGGAGEGAAGDKDDKKSSLLGGFLTKLTTK